MYAPCRKTIRESNNTLPTKKVLHVLRAYVYKLCTIILEVLSSAYVADGLCAFLTKPSAMQATLSWNWLFHRALSMFAVLP